MIGQALSAKWRRLAPRALLVALCVALGGIIAAEYLGWRNAAPPPAPAAAPAATPATATRFAMPALPTFAEVLSRPLFSATRRPSEDGTAAASAPTSMTLVAILISPRGPHALVRHGTPPQVTRVVEGDTIDGWTAETIKVDRVIFRRAAEVLELVPVSTARPSPAPAPAAPVAPIPGSRPTSPRTTG